MKLNRQKLRKLIIEEINNLSNNRIDEIVPLIPTIIPVGILAIAFGVSTADAPEIFKRLDPEIQEKLNDAYEQLSGTLSYLKDDALNDIIADVLNKIAVAADVID